MHFTIPLFERKSSSGFFCITLNMGPKTQSRQGMNPHKVQRKLVDDLRTMFEKTQAWELYRFEFTRGMHLERVRLELSIDGPNERRKVSGVCPIVLESRWVSEDKQVLFAYHPLRQQDVTPIRDDLSLEEQLRTFFQKKWAEVDDNTITDLWCRGKERINSLSFSCSPRSVFEELPEKLDDDRLGLDPAYRKSKRRGLKTIPNLGKNLTLRAAQGDLEIGVSRSPQREQLGLLLSAGRAQSIVVTGRPGCGKTTLIHQAVHDLLEADGYSSHKNLDRVREVWRISGRLLIAGMSRLGDWEKRCIDVVEDAKNRDVVLVVDDLQHFGRIGQSRESERSLADFFRGPIARREVVMIGECTPEAFRYLEYDAPSFASLFAQMPLPEATGSETFRLMVREVRRLEQLYPVAISPHTLRTIVDLGGTLFSSQAFPGKAMALLQEVFGASRHGKKPLEAAQPITSRDVLRLLSQRTGVPEILIGSEERLLPEALEQEFSRHVIGQAAAIRAAVDVMTRIKAGLSDPRRPYAVLLFTGPTGTGKTELAKCMAEYLYGSPTRLLRFDMSELSGPDAPARLIGDRYMPDGLLTKRVQEQPFSLILFDEIEKAHRSVYSLLLQLFEDGRLTDAAGRTAHFQHTVIIMTSNLGAKSRGPVGFGAAGLAGREALLVDETLKEIAGAVREFFSPELFNRIDRIVPFRPLTFEVAVHVAQKELDKLLRRRGLTERNIFVHAEAAVPERIAEQAFVAEDGARSIKRFIEDRIGALLSQAIAGTTFAAMQVIRIFPHGQDFRLDRQSLEEAPAAPGSWAIEPLLGRPLSDLVPELSSLVQFLDGLSSHGELAHLSERIRYHLREHNRGYDDTDLSLGEEHAEAIYNLDAMRTALLAFRERVEACLRHSGEDKEQEHLDLEMQRFGYLKMDHDWWGHSRIRLFHPSQVQRTNRSVTRQEVLECIAQGYALRRALSKVDEPGQHAIILELTRSIYLAENERFAKPEEGLLEALVKAYIDTEGEVDNWSAVRFDGTTERGSGISGLDKLLHGDVKVLALGLVGLCVLDFFELEAGTHVWTSLAKSPEVVRVRVLPMHTKMTSASVVSEHIQSQAAFDEAVRSGQPLPPNPATLLPVVRKMMFDPPQRKGATAVLEIEDYKMGYAETVQVRNLSQALAPLWLLRLSRV